MPTPSREHGTHAVGEIIGHESRPTTSVARSNESETDIQAIEHGRIVDSLLVLWLLQKDLAIPCIRICRSDNSDFTDAGNCTRRKARIHSKLLRVNEFIAASDNNELTNGDFVCVEGFIDHDGERMGARYCNLSESSGSPFVSCEGNELGRYQILYGKSVIVHGKIAGKHFLADVSFVTQSEVDAENTTSNE